MSSSGDGTDDPIGAHAVLDEGFWDITSIHKRAKKKKHKEKKKHSVNGGSKRVHKLTEEDKYWRTKRHALNHNKKHTSKKKRNTKRATKSTRIKRSTRSTIVRPQKPTIYASTNTLAHKKHASEEAQEDEDTAREKKERALKMRNKRKSMYVKPPESPKRTSSHTEEETKDVKLSIYLDVQNTSSDDQEAKEALKKKKPKDKVPVKKKSSLRKPPKDRRPIELTASADRNVSFTVLSRGVKKEDLPPTKKIPPIPTGSSVTRSKHARRLSIVNVASSNAFMIPLGSDSITGCYVRYTDSTEETLWTKAFANGMESSQTVSPRAWGGEGNSTFMKSIHRISFLCISDLFNLLEKRHLDTGEDKGSAFDPDDYDTEEDEIPEILKGVEVFNYSQIMSEDNAWSFENSTKMMRGRDVFERLLKNCSIHKQKFAALVLSSIASKISARCVGEYIKDRYTKAVRDYITDEHLKEIDTALPGCIFPNRFCVFHDEAKRLRGDLRQKNEESIMCREQSRESVQLASTFSDKYESALEAKIASKRQVEYYKTELTVMTELYDTAMKELGALRAKMHG